MPIFRKTQKHLKESIQFNGFGSYCMAEARSAWQIRDAYVCHSGGSWCQIKPHQNDLLFYTSH